MKIKKWSKSQYMSIIKNIALKAKDFIKLQTALKSIRTIKSKTANKNNKSGKKILIWRGPSKITASFNIELILANALRNRGHEVHFIICDGSSSACVLRTVAQMPNVENWESYCKSCIHVGRKYLETSDFPVSSSKDYFSQNEIAGIRKLADEHSLKDLKDYFYKDIPVGLFALAATIRFFKGIDPADVPNYEKVLREYLYTSILNTALSSKVFEAINPDSILMQHGIYADWGPPFELAKHMGFRITRWMRCYLRNHLYLRNDTLNDSYHLYYAPNNDIKSVLETPLTKEESEQLRVYREGQQSMNQNTHKLFHTDPLDPDSVYGKLGLSKDKPIWALFTHLNWDAQFSFEDMLYPDTTTWLLETIEIISKITDVNWIIKVHPAERILGTSKGAYGAIMDRFDKIPDHITILKPDTDINTHGLLPVLDGGLTISGTVGMELALLGKPAILAGEAHYGKKGFTYEANSVEHYKKLLESASEMPALTQEQKDKAHRFCHYFFIKRQIPFSFVKDNGSMIILNSTKRLEKGKDKVMDMICDRIENGGEFKLD